MTEATETDESELRKQRGDAVKQLRTRRGMSQAALASAAGTSQQNISLLENGDNDGSPSLWLRIARALGVSVGTLFDDPHDVEETAS